MVKFYRGRSGWAPRPPPHGHTCNHIAAITEAQAVDGRTRPYCRLSTAGRASPEPLFTLSSEDASTLDRTIIVDFSESMVASQSDLGQYWQRGVSRKRDRPVLVDLE